VDELQILVKAVVDEGSASELDSQLSDLVESRKVSIKVELDKSAADAAQTQIQAIAKQAHAANRQNGAQLKIFNVEQLLADGQKYFLGVNDIINRTKKEYGKLGKVDVTNVFKDATGNIQSFTASVTKADGVVEKFNYSLAQMNTGGKNELGFAQTNSILTDKNAGTNLEKSLDFLNRIKIRMSEIDSKTLRNTSKPLLEDMDQFTQYQEKAAEVQRAIETITSSTTTLSSEHKRAIGLMVADLKTYAQELQASAYVATDLKALAVPDTKTELQSVLNTNIQKWTNAGLFGGEFKSSVMEAKALLDNATDPAAIDEYRHKMKLLAEDLKGLKLERAKDGVLLDADKLTSNIQKAQLRIQNLKETYSAFTSDPQLLSQWQDLFDSSQIISTQKELTNLNAKIGVFEQQLISAGKHSRSMPDEFINNISKMANWMILGGVISFIMRGVSGIYGEVVNLDSAMTELKKVTDETAQSYDRFLTSAAQKSVEIGANYADFVNSTADFARLGYSLDEASKLAEVANIYNVVGDEISGVDQATSSIISTMKAFNIEAENAMTIVDKFNDVGKQLCPAA